VRDPLPQHLEHRAHPLKIGRLAADHDRQAAGLGARGAARHRCIQPVHAAGLPQLCGHLPRGAGLQAGKIHQQLPGRAACGDTVVTEHHLVHHLGVGQAQHHHVRRRAELCRAVRLARPGGHQWRALVR